MAPPAAREVGAGNLPPELWRPIASCIVAAEFSTQCAVGARGARTRGGGGAREDSGLGDADREPPRSDVQSLLCLLFKARHTILASLAQVFGVAHCADGVGRLRASAPAQLDRLLSLWNWETTSHQEMLDTASALHAQSPALGAYSQLVCAARHAADDFAAIADLRVVAMTASEEILLHGSRAPPPALCEQFFSRVYHAIAFVQQLAEAMHAVYLIASHVLVGRLLERDVAALRRALLTMSSVFHARDSSAAHLSVQLLSERALVDAAVLGALVADPPQTAVGGPVDPPLAAAVACTATVVRALLEARRGGA
ncbi:hypothetical protein PsYK624_131950 [Phanerochaete sordida]|uniref:Uncharacterized protein n=1 Tax=Phanerochaete sordida TaxID=48140 RepID=A0A9P3LJ39_9APHY|nr:hypothetical protein PsYK624_131950 [Phanerochaete sordida]